MTNITGHLVHANGQPAEGHAIVSWPAFTVYGNAIAGGHKAFDVLNGNLAVSLFPNGPAQPSGTYYTVRYELQSGPAYEEYWIVPDTPAVAVEQVRVSFPVEPGVAISPSQLTGAGASPGMILSWNGQEWKGAFVGVSNIDPNYIQFAVDNAGVDFAISGTPTILGATATFHLPDASPAARGLVTTGPQSFAGAKTFLDNMQVPSLHVTGSVTVAGSIGGPTVDWLDGRLDTLEASNVPSSRQIISGAGLTGGGDLTMDRTLSVVPDSSVQRGRLSLAGALVGTRQEINFINGANVAITVTDNPGLNRVDVTVAPAGGAGGVQTPWIQNINGAGFQLLNPSFIRVLAGSDAADAVQICGSSVASYMLLSANHSTLTGRLAFWTGSAYGKLDIQGSTVTVRDGIFQTVVHQVASSNVAATSYANAALEIREALLAGPAAGNMAYSPRLTFNWSGLAASQLGVDATGAIRTFDFTGTTPVNFHCNYLNMVANQPTGGLTRFAIETGSDGYLRWMTPANVSAFLTPSWANVAGKPSATSAHGDAIALASHLTWKNYGAPHVIFDASQGTSPSGSAVNNANSANAWTATYPSLMGWNGATTFGVRVDTARYAESSDYNALLNKPDILVNNRSSATTLAGSITSSSFGAFQGLGITDDPLAGWSIDSHLEADRSLRFYRTSNIAFWINGPGTTAARQYRLRLGSFAFNGSYASDAAAGAAGLTRGDVYVDGGGLVRAKL